jgi:hypothetical protein
LTQLKLSYTSKMNKRKVFLQILFYYMSWFVYYINNLRIAISPPHPTSPWIFGRDIAETLS